MGLIFGVLSNNCIWWYINVAKFKVLLYNLECGLRDWQDFNLTSLERIAKSINFNPGQNFYSYSSCNMGMSGLPDIYADPKPEGCRLRAEVYISGKPQGPMLQLIHKTQVEHNC